MSKATLHSSADSIAIARLAFAKLLDPAKIATLTADRASNKRMLKVLYWMEIARQSGGDVAALLEEALFSYSLGERLLIKKRLIHNHRVIRRKGCFIAEEMVKMRRGRSPIIQKGIYAGQKFEVDHIISKALVPGLMNSFANLQMLPRSINRKKSAGPDRFQRVIAGSFLDAGMITSKIHAEIMKVTPSDSPATAAEIKGSMPSAVRPQAPLSQPSSATGSLDVTRLTLGLLHYAAALRDQRGKLEQNVDNIRRSFDALFDSYSGRQSEELQHHWRGTTEWFSNYLAKVRVLLQFLEDRITHLKHL